MEERTKIFLIIGGVVLLVAALLAPRFYNSNKAFAHAVDTYVLGTDSSGTQLHVAVQTKETVLFFIADNTGSMKKYSIPKLDTSVISKSVDMIQKSGGGYIFLSSFDRNIKNNENLYFRIPGYLCGMSTPVRKSGETYFEYDRRLKAYNKENEKYQKDSTSALETFRQYKKEYLIRVSQYLDQVYGSVTKEDGATNVKDMLSAAFSCENSLASENIRKYVIGYSDFEETVHKNGTSEFSMPADVTIIAVNPVPGTIKTKISDKIIEVHPDRLFNSLF